MKLKQSQKANELASSVISDGNDLDDLEELDRLNSNVELDEAVSSARTQLFSVDTSSCGDDARLLVDVKPPGTTANTSAITCHVTRTNTSKYRITIRT